MVLCKYNNKLIFSSFERVTLGDKANITLTGFFVFVMFTHKCIINSLHTCFQIIFVINRSSSTFTVQKATAQKATWPLNTVNYVLWLSYKTITAVIRLTNVSKPNSRHIDILPFNITEVKICLLHVRKLLLVGINGTSSTNQRVHILRLEIFLSENFEYKQC